MNKKHVGRWIAVALACAGMFGCALRQGQSESRDVAAATLSVVPALTAPELPVSASGWEHATLPGKRPAQFRQTRAHGREAVSVTAASAASMLRRKVRVEADQLGLLRFSWRVPALMARSDLGHRDTADSAVRVILAFEGDRSRFSGRDQLLSDLARSLTGEELPYATLMYVWCNHRTPGTVIRNPRTERIRKLVLESGPSKLNQWLDYERDIRADFERVYGEPPGALVGIAIMTDSDNTRSTARASYGPVSLERRRPELPAAP